MERKIEYAIASVTTNKVVTFKIFDTEKRAEAYRLMMAEPNHWKVVKRTVIYSEWE